ncbi:hypothetical protein CK203_089225 [Vitis vinifera]|uniref:Uncharacterized protein n=1 Tax=Vitis vinifera TaxID=29760 RepID=A0A438D056_VITVI|nr:hypothetical protein CK203_089225 [Vitis vinifera]
MPTKKDVASFSMGRFVGVSGRDFCPNYSLKLLGTHERGRLVEWVEKASFDSLNKLFEITIVERHYQTLLIARNLLAVVREP